MRKDMYCYKCGSEEKDQHCSKCGEKLEELNVIDSDLSMEERSIIRGKQIGKKITYAVIAVVTSCVILSSIVSAATQIIDGVESKVEEANRQKEEEKRAKEAEKEKNRTVAEKREKYYNSVVEEYQQKSQNEDLYVTLIDLCEDESPELIISRYNISTKAYKIQNVYGYEDNSGKNI